MRAPNSGPVRLKPSRRVTAITISSSDKSPFSRVAIFAAARISRGDSISARCRLMGAELRSRTEGSTSWLGVIQNPSSSTTAEEFLRTISDFSDAAPISDPVRDLPNSEVTRRATSSRWIGPSVSTMALVMWAIWAIGVRCGSRPCGTPHSASTYAGICGLGTAGFDAGAPGLAA